MKRGLLLIVFAFGMASCVTGHVVMAPDGQPATFVTCHNYQQKCYVKAQRICPWGFEVLDAPYGSLLFRCGPYPETPQPEQDQDAPAAPETTPRPPEQKLYRT